MMEGLRQLGGRAAVAAGASPRLASTHPAHAGMVEHDRGLRPVRMRQSMLWSYCFLASDLLSLVLVFVVAFALAGLINSLMLGRLWGVPPHEVVSRIYDFTFLGLVLVGYLYQRGHYVRRLGFWTAAGDVLRVSLLGMLLDGFVQFALQQVVSRSWFLCIWGLLPLTMVGLRALVRQGLDLAGLWRRRVVLAGRPVEARGAQAALLSDASMGYEIAGRMTIADVLEQPDAAGAMMSQREASLLVFAPGDDIFHLARPVVAALVRARVDFAIMPSLEGLPASGYDAQAFFGHDLLLLSYRNNTDLPFARVAKRMMDVLGAAFLLILLSPAIALIALAIRRDGGPVFYAQRRIGRGGQEFGCLKFRSMVMNADAVLRETLARDPRAAAEWAAAQKLRRDPRVTGIGQLLRKSSLDELPQLINVLKGDMSLVGPRPIIAREMARYGDDIAFYTSVRPGLTGLWQVSGRNDTSYGRKVLLDSHYVKNWSLWQDVAILLRTVPAVLLRRGAF